MKLSALLPCLLTTSSATSIIRPSQMAPSSEVIAGIFQPLSVQGEQIKFFDSVADNVNWTIQGHSPLSGLYTSKEEFVNKTIKYLGEQVLTAPLTLKVVNIVGGGDSDWAAIEMVAIDAQCKNGLKYDMVYNWVCQFNQNNTIVKVRAYLDTQLLTSAIIG